MLQQLNRIRREESGFTLVEMLVVVAIIGVLASVAVVAVGGMTGESREAACNADVAAVQTAADAYLAREGSTAANIAALTGGANPLLRGYSAKTVANDGYGFSFANGVITMEAGSACTP